MPSLAVFVQTPRVFSSMTTVQPPKYDESVADSAPPRETASHLDQHCTRPLRKEIVEKPADPVWTILILAAVGGGGWAALSFQSHRDKVRRRRPLQGHGARPVPVVGC